MSAPPKDQAQPLPGLTGHAGGTLWLGGEPSAQQLLGAISAAVYTCDAEGRITFFNAAAERLWGRPPVLGQDRWCGSLKIYTPEGEPLRHEDCPMGIALREGRRVEGVEILVERPDGAVRRVRPHPEPIRDESGRVVGAVNLLQDVTERHEAERAKALLAAIVESSDDAIVSKTLEGRIVSWNRGAERIFGYTSEEIVGRSITTLIPEERLGEEDEILRRLRRGERVEHFETVRVHKDGHPVEISVTISPVFDGSGRVVGASKIARDVTAQKRAERAQAVLAAIVESSDDAIVSKSLDGRVISWNEGAARIFGYSAEEIVGLSITTIIPEDRLTEEKAILQHVRRGERVEHYETVRLAKDGRRVDVSVTVSPVRDRHGAIVGASKIGRDITAQKAAERALRENEQKLRALLALLPVGVYACDAAGRITFYNRRAVELWGREPLESGDDLRYCACARMFRMDGTPLAMEEIPMAVALREGRSLRSEEAILERPDGTRIPVSVNVDPVTDETGRALGAINAFHDISDQVQAREANLRHRAALEEAVAERTRELEQTHGRLRLSERMASLGTLSAGLGHDLGNLLLPVRVSLQALAEADLGEASRADVERIRTSTDYLQQLASGLRMLALDPERAGHSEPTELCSWWAEAHAIVRNALPRTVDLEAEFPEGCCVMASRPALTQAVFNLVQNAGDAMRTRGHGLVRLSARCEGARVLLDVEDNGPGMSAEVRDRCMEPFFTTKTRAISTGLGLVLVAGLVRDAGGTVRLRSEPGAGTTFTLDFPGADPAQLAAGRVRGVALVDVADPRLRALVTSELDHLALEIVGAEGGGRGVDLAVVDEGAAHEGARRVIVLGEADAEIAGATAIGRRPRPSTIRRALRAALEELDGQEGSR